MTKWLKKPGDTVERDEPLFEISTDKVDTEIPSPAAGTLTEVLVQEGATVGINTVVARIGEANGAGGCSGPCRTCGEGSGSAGGEGCGTGARNFSARAGGRAGTREESRT